MGLTNEGLGNKVRKGNTITLWPPFMNPVAPNERMCRAAPAIGRVTFYAEDNTPS